MVFQVTTYTYLPSPIDLLKSFYEMRNNIGPAVLASLGITLSGFFIGVSFGLLMGLAMAYSKKFMETIGPFMEFTRPIPIFAMIPLFMIWFGLGLWPQILLVALGVSAILGVQTYEAVRNIPMVYLRAAYNLGAEKRVIFKTVVIPYIVPHLIGAIRVAAATSWGLDVAAEFMGVQVGLGYNMIVQQMYLNTPGILSIVIIYSVLAITLDQIIAKIEKKVTRWTDRENISFENMKKAK
jgi:ABC-type nitrate/sulfonate/bicarbonate transport system permease component